MDRLLDDRERVQILYFSTVGVPDGVVAIFIGNDPDGGGNLLFAGQPVCFFQIQEQIVHIRVCDGGAGTVVADGLDDVGSLGQQIFCDCPGKQRVILKDGQAVADTVADAAFLGDSSMALTSSTLRGGGASCMVCSAACRISGGKLCHSCLLYTS